MTPREPWYPDAAEYWVPAAEDSLYPLRFGDLFASPAGAVSTTGNPWLAALALYPSCELGAKAKPGSPVVLARVHRVDEHADPNEQARLVAGFEEKNQVIKIAFAHTFFLGPVPTAPGLDGPLYVNFRSLVTARFVELQRLAAMTHDVRCFLIRREMYFRYRWGAISLAQVRENEAARIRSDDAFQGPKPDWAA